MKEHPSQIDWIRKNKDILNLKEIATQTKVPIKNLWSYCNGVHSLNENHWPTVIEWVNKRLHSAIH